MGLSWTKHDVRISQEFYILSQSLDLETILRMGEDLGQISFDFSLTLDQFADVNAFLNEA